MAGFRAPDSSFLLLCLVFLVLCVRPSHAFGAGNIASVSKIEGQNWRHGDIEDVLLSLLASRATNKKFSKLDVKRVYFGNWLRDYSQAVDVGALKMVSADAIRLLLWILGFISFGYGTKEFEVTRDRLGCYRPEEHIDNPKDYADNEDARQYDRRLRGPVDERRELSVDERTGLKNYIASEDLGITTSAGLVRDLYRRCIDLGRRARRNRNDDDLYEAFRLLGTANHCLEDYSAHSNYVELCLIEMGERDVFPHVGRRTQVQVRGARGPIWPLITGTFGGVDFLHSVMGEVSDKATQSEIDELEGTITNAERNRESASVIRDLLNKLPDGLIGGEDASKPDELQQNVNTAQMQNMQISPKDPEEFTQQAEEIRRQIYPAIEFHDNLMRNITETIDKIPILPELLEQLQEHLNIFIFSLIAPFVLPIIKQIKAELSTGSSEIIDSSRSKQHIVFEDDNSTDPTHSMISKDHFSNVLNEPAGKVASSVIKWVVPQIVECWDDDRADAERTINRIIQGVFHHPALRDSGDDGARDGRSLMFRSVEGWWREQSDRSKSDLRDKLSRSGVEQGRNHKEGVHDKGHGCGKPLGMPNVGTSASSGAIGGVLGAGLMGGLNNAMNEGRQSGSSRPHDQVSQNVGNAVGEAVGGGLLGSVVGGIVGGVGGSLLGGAFKDEEKKVSTSSGYGRDGSYTQSYTETAQRPSSRRDDDRGSSYGQASYQRTDYGGGGRREEYSRVEQTSNYGGGYERTEQSTYQSGGRYESRTETHSGGYGRSEEYGSSDSRRHGKKKPDSEDDDSEPEWKKREKKERKKREKEEKKRLKAQRRREGYADDSNDSDDSDDKPKRHSREYGRRDDDDDNDRKRRSGGGGRSEYGRQEQSYGERQSYGRRDDDERREESGGYGRRQEESYGGGGGYGRQEQSSYGGGGGYGRQEESYGGSGGYGRQEESYGGRRRDDDDNEGYGRRQRDNDNDDNEYGGRRRRDSNEGRGYGSGGGYGGGYGGGGY